MESTISVNINYENGFPVKNHTAYNALTDGLKIEQVLWLQWSADLMDLVKFAKYNDGYRYILVVIDVFPNTCGFEN